MIRAAVKNKNLDQLAACGLKFTSASQLPVRRETRRIIVAQPGYRRGTQMILARTSDCDGIRLYAHVGGRWMDGSLTDMRAGSADGSKA